MHQRTLEQLKEGVKIVKNGNMNVGNNGSIGLLEIIRLELIDAKNEGRMSDALLLSKIIRRYEEGLSMRTGSGSNYTLPVKPPFKFIDKLKLHLEIFR